MGKYPTLKKAPIVEALADIQVTFPQGVDIAKIETVYQELADRFPNREQQGFVEFGVTTTPQGLPQSFNAKSSFAGLRLSSVDKKRIIQVGGRGFTFSQLAPYRNGDEFRDEASTLWNTFAEVTKPASVRRLALRCINRIELPLPFHDFDEYFQTFIRLAPGIPQSLAELLVRFALPHPNNPNMAALVTLQVEPVQPNASHIAVLFDIDVFQMVSLEPTDPQIWEILATLREFRNQIFFESLTPEALRMYQ